MRPAPHATPTELRIKIMVVKFAALLAIASIAALAFAIPGRHSVVAPLSLARPPEEPIIGVFQVETRPLELDFARADCRTLTAVMIATWANSRGRAYTLICSTCNASAVPAAAVTAASCPPRVHLLLGEAAKRAPVH